MTLAELEQSLPNGLHDAELTAVAVDYLTQQLVIGVNVDVGDSDAVDDRPARVRFIGLQFVVIDPPAAEGSYFGRSRIDTGAGEPATSSCLLPPLHEGCFLCWIFVTRWNSFIRIAARDVALEW